MAAMQRHWDIFCRVIDNFGDIGVCWRLARQLAGEHGLDVRLWVDELAVLAPLCPASDPQQAQQRIEGVEIRHWTPSVEIDRVADVVIEAFACELPEIYQQKMAERPVKPCWINLEYLTAEDWATSCHGMASPHPRLPLVKYFYFPGFLAASGGLLRERGVPEAPLPALSAQPLEISLFCYDTAPVCALLACLADAPTPVLCHVPPGKPLAAVRACLGGNAPWQLGSLTVRAIPFLPLDDYDRLLRNCALNFVRGEDSFLRAQWAHRPFVWQIYEQADSAHLTKLQAFLDLYTAAMAPAQRAAITAFFLAWNTGTGVAEAWPAFAASLPKLATHNTAWAAQLAEQTDLAAALVKFCSSKV
jgi:uncharacterized repeat protein (TIGR03837 family)